MFQFSVSSNIFMLMILVGAISSLIFLQIYNVYTSQIQSISVRHSPSVDESLMASIIVTVPIIIEMLFDFPMIINKEEAIFYSIRLVMLFNLMIPSIVLRFNNSSSTFATLYPLLLSIRVITTLGTILTYLNSLYFRSIWRLSNTISIFGFLVAGVFCQLLARGKSSDLLSLLSIIFIIFSTFQFICTSFIWIWGNLHNIIDTEQSQCYRVSTIYLFSYVAEVITVVVIILQNHHSNEWNTIHLYDSNHISTLIYVQIAFTVLNTILPGRLSRTEQISIYADAKSKRTFIRYVSHEIRTPLNTISLGLTLLGSLFNNDTTVSSTADIERAHTVADVQKSCDAAMKILNDLLTYDKLEKGILHLDIKQIKAIYYFNKTIKNSISKAEELGYSFQFQISDANVTNHGFEDKLHHIYINIDEQKLSLVIDALISNAIKFSSIGSTIIFRVEISDSLSLESMTMMAMNLKNDNKARLSSNKLRFLVIDCGQGISAEDADKVFSDIVQFNPGQLRGGAGDGLGLYISKSIVELHGGQLGYTSDGSHKGSQFYIDLPYEKKAFSSSSDSFMSNIASNAQFILAPLRNAIESSHSITSFRSSSSSKVTSGYQLFSKSHSSIINHRKVYLNVATTSKDNQSSENSEIISINTRNHSFSSFIGNDSFHPNKMIHQDVVSEFVDIPRRRHSDDKNHIMTLESISEKPYGLVEYNSSSNLVNNISSKITSHRIKFKPMVSFNENHQNDNINEQNSSSTRVTINPIDCNLSMELPKSIVDEETKERSDENIINKNDVRNNNNNNPVDPLPVVVPVKVSLPRALIVDDSALTRKMLNKIMTREGFDCIEVTDGDEAVKLIEAIMDSMERVNIMKQVNNISGITRRSIRQSFIDTFVRGSPRNSVKMSSSPRGGNDYKITTNIRKSYFRSSFGVDNTTTPLPAISSPNDNNHNNNDTFENEDYSAFTILPDYDVILMDFVMERMNGPDAAKRMRDMGYNGIILGVTGNALAGDIQHFIQQGANAVLTKPLDIKLFKRTYE
eukprot:gene9266-12482_t